MGTNERRSEASPNTGYEGAEAMGRIATSDEAVVIDLGEISHLAWPGAVSASKLIEDGVASAATINEAIARLNEFYVPVNPGAKTRCIDGRHDPELKEDNLGPQVPGGAPGAALAFKLGVDKDSLTTGTFLTDAEKMIDMFLRLGFAPGGHRDENSEGDAVGCGAIDGMDKVLATMINPSLVDDHKRVVEALMGTKLFDRDDYLRVLGGALVLGGRADSYFRDRGAIIDIMEKRSKKSIAVLEGVHQECLVAVNLVPNTTLSSNRFAKEFNGMQAFGYDLWRSMVMAEKVLSRPDQTIDRKRFVMARVMSTVATLMALTDGSQKLVLRTLPENREPLVPAPLE